MISYYLQIAWRSLLRKPAITTLMIATLGLGVAIAMISYSVLLAVSGDPLPDRSSRLYVPLIDHWGPDRNYGGEPPDALSYRDALALLQASVASRQTAVFPVTLPIATSAAAGRPLAAEGYAVHADFFPMFSVPFQFGATWDSEGAEGPGAVVVLSRRLNDRLFEGANSIGREVVVEERVYRVIGVADNWEPSPRFYDVFTSGGYGPMPDLFVPFEEAISLRAYTSGYEDCSGRDDAGDTWEEWLRSECAWVSLWVELPNAAAQQRYKDFLEGYAREQAATNRFGWPPNVRLRNLTDWLAFKEVVPPEAKMSVLVALGFLLVCLVNTVCLLLAKFMGRAQEIGTRRALGASKFQIYAQFFTEAMLVGLAAGALALLLMAGGSTAAALVFEPSIARLAKVDPGLAVLTLLVAVLGTLLASLIPVIKAAGLEPASHLKSN